MVTYFGLYTSSEDAVWRKDAVAQETITVRHFSMTDKVEYT